MFTIDKNCQGGSCLLEMKSQQRIIRSVYRTWRGLAPLLGRESLSYSEGMEIALQMFGPGGLPISFLSLTFAGDLVPLWPDDEASRFPELLASIDTQEKFESLLASAPEPDPSTVDAITATIDRLLPEIRKRLVQQSEELPQHRGGRKQLLSSPAERNSVREEIMRLRRPGMRLEDIFKRVGLKRGVSASKIKQVWLEGKSKD